MLTDPAPVVDLEALALLFAPPALLGEFVPACLWRGVDRVAPAEDRPVESASLRAVFRTAVADVVADSERIGVLVSGGLDSLAVLFHACEVADGRRVLAFTTDLVDDAGVAAGDVVRALIAALRLPAELVVLPAVGTSVEPSWSPAAPRLDALPGANARAAQLAHDRGVGVLLSGDGADELLGVPRFAFAAVAAQYDPAGGLRYVRDVARSGPGVLGELAGLAAQVLPRRLRARMYWAANWPEWCDPTASPVLAEPYRSVATDWAQQWVLQQIDDHAAVGRTWAEADAHDSFYPHDPIPAAGQVPTQPPFLAPAFISAALAIPLGRRFDPALPTAYQRCKAQVVDLFPAHLQATLPRAKQYFTTALTHLMPADRVAPLATAAGLFDQAALAVEDDPSVLLMAAATERWLARAQEVAGSTP